MTLATDTVTCGAVYEGDTDHPCERTLGHRGPHLWTEGERAGLWNDRQFRTIVYRPTEEPA